MVQKLLIGTDIGTSSTKSVLMDPNGKVLGSSMREYGVLTPNPLWVEQWPDVWFEAVCETIREVVSISKVAPKDVAGICISGLYGGSGVPCDSDMKPVRPCIIWMDRRTQQQCDWISENISTDELMTVTANGVDPYFGYTKILWIRDNEPENWKKTACFLPPNAYVIYRLTGEAAVDYSSAGNLGGIYDARNSCWSSSLMIKMGIPPELMPGKLVQASDVVGELSSVAAARMGLKSGIPVCAGTIDCLSSTLSAGVISPGKHVAVLGTSLNWGFVHENFPNNASFVSMPYVIDPKKKFYTYGGTSSAGALPRWFRDNFGSEEVRQSEAEGIDAYDLLNIQASRIPAGSEGLLVLPYFMGERSPIWDSNARGTITGLTLNHTRVHIYRSLLEGVAYSLRHVMESFSKSKNHGEECILVGAATKSTLWKQILADVTGLKITTTVTNVEAPLADAFLAGIGAGVIKGYSEIENWVQFNEPVVPDERNHEMYSEYFKIYLQLYPAMKEQMHGLTKIKP
jgi:ribulokinase